MPGDLIDGYFGDKAIGARMTSKQVTEGIDFFINCQKDNDHVTKICLPMVSLMTTSCNFLDGERWANYS